MKDSNQFAGAWVKEDDPAKTLQRLADTDEIIEVIHARVRISARHVDPAFAFRDLVCPWTVGEERGHVERFLSDKWLIRQA